MYNSSGALKILHINVKIEESDMVYNEHCLPMADKYDITMCSYFESDIKPPETIKLFEGDGSLKGFFRALRAALAEKEYDIIHAHSPHVGFLFLPVILFTYRKFMPLTVITVHDSYQNYKLRNKLLYIPVFASFQKVICCGQASYHSFPAFYKWLAGDRLGAVQNGLDIERIDRIAANIHQQPRPSDEFTIVAISRLVDVKNPTSLLAAFQQSIDNSNQTSHLIYMGYGPLRDSLLSMSREAGLENQIEFTGLIPREDVFKHLLGADLFISTSKGEGLPVAVLEAMACGRPVILSDIPPHREIAEDVDFIPLIPPEDEDGFAREIRKFRKMTVSERTSIGQKCRKLVEEQFSLKAMHSRYAEVYAQITGNHIPSLPEVA
jgi:glycosyltransferase involved in cell wall biosynthesis